MANKYGVSGIPALIVIKPNGDVVSKDGRAEVQVTFLLEKTISSKFRVNLQKRSLLTGKLRPNNIFRTLSMRQR